MKNVKIMTKKFWEFLKDFFNNMMLMEMIILVLLAYVNMTNTYPTMLSAFVIYMIIDSVLTRIDKNNLKK